MFGAHHMEIKFEPHYSTAFNRNMKLVCILNGLMPQDLITLVTEWNINS
jgi:hypothetical protein